MIKIFNNQLKEKYLSFHKISNINPKNIKNILRFNHQNSSDNFNSYTKIKPLIKGKKTYPQRVSQSDLTKIPQAIYPLRESLNFNVEKQNKESLVSNRLTRTLFKGSVEEKNRYKYLNPGVGSEKKEGYKAIQEKGVTPLEGLRQELRQNTKRDQFIDNKEESLNRSFKKTRRLNRILNETDNYLLDNKKGDRNIRKKAKSRSPLKGGGALDLFKSFNEQNYLTNNKLSEKKWKEMWLNKFNKFTELGLFTSEDSDKKWFSLLNEKRQNIKSRYSFNEFLSSSQLITYNFNKNSKKIDLNSLYKFLKSFFTTLSSLISFPVLEFSPDKIKIRFFYYILPSFSKRTNQRKLNKYIRYDNKLYEEIKNRRRFRKIMTNFKMKLFISKWKEENNLIRLPPYLSIGDHIYNTMVYLIKPLFPQSLTQAQLPKIEGGNYGDEAIPVPNSRSLLSQSKAFGREQTSNRSETEMFSFEGENRRRFPLFSEPAQREVAGVMDDRKDLLNSPHFEERTITVNPVFVNINNISSHSASDSLNLTELTRKGDTFSSSQDNDINVRNIDKKMIQAEKEERRLGDPEPLSLRPALSPTATTFPSSTYENEGKTTVTLGEAGKARLPFPFHLREDLGEEGGHSQREALEVVMRGKAERGRDGEITPPNLQLLTNNTVSTMVSLNKTKFKYLIFILEKFFKKTIILDLIRLKYPYHESNILAQVFGLSSKNTNFRVMMRKLLYTATIKNPTKMIRKQNFSTLPSYLSGIKVRLAGRLITQRVVPRFTVQSFQMGSLARGKINFTDSSRFTHKNKRGAFSFTVTTSHIFENYK